MRPVKKTDISIISCLRNNARQRLSSISKDTGVPISTIHDRIKHHQRGLIVRHTALVDFQKLGFRTRANISLKIDRNTKDSLKDFLMEYPYVNSIQKVNNGFDFIVEGVFRDMSDFEQFMDQLSQFNIEKKQISYVIEDICREAFLSDPKKAVFLKEFED